MKIIYCFCLFYLQILAVPYTKQLTTMEELLVLKKHGTYVRNATELLKKINDMIHMGPNHLLIMTDYDKTLTTFNPGDNSKKVLNSFLMLRICPSIPQSYKDEDERLFLKYYKLVIDPELNIKEQTNYMNEWYNARVNLLKGVKFPKNEFKAIAGDATRVTLREGVQNFVSWSHINNVPVIVISAGLGDGVEAALEANDVLLSNVKVISNFLAINETDHILGWKSTIIHHHNKNKVIHNNVETLQGRKNVIVMGDELWDANMTDTINFDNKIKIGFISSKIMLNLQEYIDTFDVVLVEDQTMDVINTIVNHIG